MAQKVREIAMATTTLVTAGGLLPLDIQEKAAARAKSLVLDAKRPETVAAIGTPAQEKSADISKQFLNHIQVKDAGQAGDLLLKLTSHCKSVDADKLIPKSGFLSKIPFLKKTIASAENVLGSYKGVLSQLDTVKTQLTTAQQTLMSDVTMLNGLYDQNVATYQDLQIWVEACRIKLKEFDEEKIPAARTKAESNPTDGFAALAFQEEQSLREALDKRTHDLELTMMIRLQNAPKIRVVQAGDMQLAQKLQSSVLNTLPLWMDNLTLAIAQVRQKEAADLDKAVDDTTNDLLRSSADMLHTTTVQIAQQANRGIVDLDTLKYTQTQLLATISEAQQIEADGRKNRDAARLELATMEQDLKQKLLSK